MALKAAFMLAVTWAVVVAFAPQVEVILSMNPVAEGAPAHGLYEVAVLLAVLAAVGVACLVAYRRWPKFLQVDPDVSLAAVLWRLIAGAPVVFVLVGLVVFALAWLFPAPAEEAGNPQYGLSAWWAGYYYALILTPVITVAGVWLQLRRRVREGGI